MRESFRLEHTHKDIAIIGGGASGFACALTLARLCAEADKQVEITIFEQSERCLKSVLRSGNGRCNISNANVCKDDYYQPQHLSEVFDIVDKEDVFAFLDYVGLMLSEEDGGRLYPLSNKASVVVDCLRSKAEMLGVNVENNARVDSFCTNCDSVFLKFASDRDFRADYLLLSVGGGIFSFRDSLKDQLVDQEKLLCPIKCSFLRSNSLANVRQKCLLSVFDSNRDSLFAEYGEVQFRDYGISGIAAFNASRFIEDGCSVCLDFLPQITLQQLVDNLAKRNALFLGASTFDLLQGIVPKQILEYIFHCCAISKIDHIDHKQLFKIAALLKSFDLKDCLTNPAAGYQVSRGGISLGAVSSSTLELKCEPCVYVAGEALNVDGPCGGYNLHWAWASAICAAKSIFARIEGACE